MDAAILDGHFKGQEMSSDSFDSAISVSSVEVSQPVGVSSDSTAYSSSVRNYILSNCTLDGERRKCNICKHAWSTNTNAVNLNSHFEKGDKAHRDIWSKRPGSVSSGQKTITQSFSEQEQDVLFNDVVELFIEEYILLLLAE